MVGGGRDVERWRKGKAIAHGYSISGGSNVFPLWWELPGSGSYIKSKTIGHESLVLCMTKSHVER
jgi:hypothetical protein